MSKERTKFIFSSIFMLLALTLSLANSGIVKAQTQSLKFSIYKDPEGRFTIDYPPAWNATQSANRFAASLVEFSSPQPLALLDVRLAKNIPVDVETAMSGTESHLTYSVPNFELNQGVECHKYTINGNKACSIIYSRTLDYSSDEKIAVMDVGTIVNGNFYIFVYNSNLDNFDSNLPVIDKMINSFKIPINATGTT
jgi:hypothetical protein